MTCKRASLAHPVLGHRLVECTALVNHVEPSTAAEVFQPSPFEDALRKYDRAEPDPKTLDLLHAA
jgi:uncharacterized protein (DUF1810 family)